MANKIYTISLRFDSQASENPLEAAKKIAKMLNEDGASDLIYDVEDENTGEKFTVDLSEEDEDAVLPND